MVDPKPNTRAMVAPGPFRAEQIRDGDPYELSRGHAIFVSPTGRAGALRQGLAWQVLATDPDAVGVAIDPGISPEPGTLRAPDVALGISDGRGWEPNAPPLALEYADRGQDEVELQEKIGELLALGTRHIWVVRLGGPRRVEVYEPNRPMRIVDGSGELLAPGLLRNPVPVAALYDREEADRIAFRNMLQREGYESMEAVRAEGLERGIEQGLERGIEQGLERGIEQGLERGIEQGALEGRRSVLRRLLEKRFGPLPTEAGARLERADAATLESLAVRVLDAHDLGEALSGLA